MINATITAFGRSAMLLFHEVDMGEAICLLTQPIGGAVTGAVIDDYHFVVFDFSAGILVFQCLKTLFKNGASVVGGDDDADEHPCETGTRGLQPKAIKKEGSPPLS
jgi:hypothetical protein